MEVGPVDVYIIGFPGNKFTGRIAPAIAELVDDGTIRVLDLLFVMKDENGVVTTIEIEDLDQEGAAFAEIDITEPGSLNHEDADEVSEDLPANSSALLIAFENVWARKVASALEAADAVLIDSIRIPFEVAIRRLPSGVSSTESPGLTWASLRGFGRSVRNAKPVLPVSSTKIDTGAFEPCVAGTVVSPASTSSTRRRSMLRSAMRFVGSRASAVW